MAIKDLRKNGMMSHLADALESGRDIGHYGRLVFAMIGRHFLSEDELVRWLTKNPDFDETQALALVEQVQARDYNPPKPQRIRQWQQEQDFPICPTNDPDACNVYKDLQFPEGVYEHIQEYYEAKAEK